MKTSHHRSMKLAPVWVMAVSALAYNGPLSAADTLQSSGALRQTAPTIPDKPVSPTTPTTPTAPTTPTTPTPTPEPTPTPTPPPGPTPEPVSLDQYYRINSLATITQLTTVSNVFNRPTTTAEFSIRKLAGQHLAAQQKSGGGSSSDGVELDGRFGTFFSGGGSFGNMNGQASAIQGLSRDPFSTFNQTGTGAFDFKFTDWLVAGFLFNYTGTQNSLSAPAAPGSLLSDAYRFMPFVSMIPFENAYIDVSAGYGYQTYNSRRMFNGGNAIANYSSDQAMAAIDMGYNYSVDALELGAFIGGSYIGTDVSGYTEYGSGISMQPYNISSWTTTLGGQLAYSFSTSFAVLQPMVRMEWVHAFNTFTTANAVLPLGGGLQPIQSVLGISDWGNFSAGVQATLPNGMNAFINYQGQVMAGGDNNGVLGGLRLEF